MRPQNMQWHAACTISVVLAEEFNDVLCKQLGLLHGCEMPACEHTFIV